MTSREAVLAAIAHKDTGPVPVDLGATPSSGISAIAYHNLIPQLAQRCNKTNAQSIPCVYDVVQELAQPEDWVLDCLGIDVVDVGRSYNTRPQDWKQWEMPDGSQYFYPAWFSPTREGDDFFVYDAEGTLLAQRPKGATFFDERCFPYMDAYPPHYRDLPKAMKKVLWSALVHSPWDHASEEGFWDKLRVRCLELKKTTDKALLIGVGCNLFEWGTFLRRLDNFLVDILIDQENAEKLLDALVEIHLATLEKVCAYVGDIVDIIRFGDDLGHEGGPLMPPDIYRKIFKPRHSILVNYVTTHSTMKPFLHSCGSIYELMPDLIEVGYDIINPVQTSARDMDPGRLKKEFGRDITFWGGGIENRTVLNGGSPAQVRAQTLERLEIFSHGGGYVFNTVHNIMPDVPAQNILAMFDAVKEFNGKK